MTSSILHSQNDTDSKTVGTFQLSNYAIVIQNIGFKISRLEISLNNNNLDGIMDAFNKQFMSL